MTELQKRKTNTFIQKAKLKHKNKFNYDKSIFIANNKKLIITYNGTDILVTPRTHLCTITGLPSDKINSTESFIEKSKKAFGENTFDYSKVVYKSSKEPITLIKDGKEYTVTRHMHFNSKYGIPHLYDDEFDFTSTFIKNSKERYGENTFDYSKTVYNGHENELILIKDDEEFLITPKAHYKNPNGLPSSRVNSKRLFIKKSKELFKNTFDYSKVVYKSSRKPLILIKDKIEYLVTPKEHFSNFNGLPKIPYTSVAQLEIYEYIKSIYPNTVLNDRTLLKPYEVDILVSDKDGTKFGIEYNGIVYHSYNPYMFPSKGKEDKNKYRDFKKTIQCNKKGFALFHIWDIEYTNPDKKAIWMSIINDKLNLTDTINIEDSVICELSDNTAKEFLEKNHLEGESDYKEHEKYKRCARTNIGLYVNSTLMQVVSFNEDVITRLCTKINTSDTRGYKRIIDFYKSKYYQKYLTLITNPRYDPLTESDYKYLGFNSFYFTKPKALFIKNNDIIPESGLVHQESLYKNEYRRVYDCGLKFYK